MVVRSQYNFREVTAAVALATQQGLVDGAQAELEHVQSNMDNGRDALGRGFTPLAPETIRRKGHATPLKETGAMQDSGYVSENEGEVRLGFSDWKTSFHVLGTEDIPRRDFLTPAKTHMQQSRVFYGPLARRIGMALAGIRVSGVFR